MFSWFKRKKESQSSIATPQKPIFNDVVAQEILKDIQKEFGLDYSKQEYITMRKLERFSLKNGMYSFEELQQQLHNSLACKQKLLNRLTIGETYFYREITHLKLLVNLMKQKKITRILSAPSSSGEEVYSILLFLQEHFFQTPNIEIIGIDINSEAIELAKEALYSKRSISFLPQNLLEKNFILQGNKYKVNPIFKKYTSFYTINIFDTQALQTLGKFEIIFCRNMLIYFNDEQKKEVLNNLKTLLVKDGILFLGHADISFKPEGFKDIHTKEGTYFQLN